MLARFLGFIFAPTGVLLGIWAVREMLTTPPTAAWVGPLLGIAMALAMIIVGVRYILKKQEAGPNGGA
jgi:hypothetical protein